MAKSDSVRQVLEKKRPPVVSRPEDFLSTGSTLLNLACSGQPFGGFEKGGYYFVVGDSTAGKTWIALTCLAEAAMNENFNDYRFIFDEVEDGAKMDIGRFFGEEAASRIEPPEYGEEDQSIHSTTVETFYYHIDTAIQYALEKKRPFIYILDSQDALEGEAANEKFEKQKAAYAKGTEAPGSYGDGKAKAHSENIRRVLRGLRDTKSILIITGQTRDNIGGMGDPKTRSGGKSLRFYAHIELWLSVFKKLTQTVNEKPRQIGIISEIQAKKNRFTGQLHRVQLPIYNSYGIDDVGACIDWLVGEKHWKVVESSITAPEFKFKGTRASLIKVIDERQQYRELSLLVAEVWENIEAACQIKRKPKYT